MRKAFIITEGEFGWTWKFRAENGKIVATGGVFTRKADAMETIKNLSDLIKNSPIKEE